MVATKYVRDLASALHWVFALKPVSIGMRLGRTRYPAELVDNELVAELGIYASHDAWVIASEREGTAHVTGNYVTLPSTIWERIRTLRILAYEANLVLAETIGVKANLSPLI